VYEKEEGRIGKKNWNQSEAERNSKKLEKGVGRKEIEKEKIEK
jgi:hypothetical protein